MNIIAKSTIFYGGKRYAPKNIIENIPDAEGATLIKGGFAEEYKSVIKPASDSKVVVKTETPPETHAPAQVGKKAKAETTGYGG